MKFIAEQPLFYPTWLVHLCIKNELLQYFSQLFQSRIYLNVEINKLGWLKQFDMTDFSFCVLILLADNKWFDTTWGCYLINLGTLIFITFKMLKHPTFVECHFWKFSETLNANLQLLNLRLEFGYILKSTNSPSYNRLVWEKPFCFSVLDVFYR